MSKDVGRVVVSGHAASVGIVGWTLGGGHGQLAPLFGLGVDQVKQRIVSISLKSRSPNVKFSSKIFYFLLDKPEWQL
jgi:hypothetical protein